MVDVPVVLVFVLLVVVDDADVGVLVPVVVVLETLVVVEDMDVVVFVPLVVVEDIVVVVVLVVSQFTNDVLKKACVFVVSIAFRNDASVSAVYNAHTPPCPLKLIDLHVSSSKHDEAQTSSDAILVVRTILVP